MRELAVALSLDSDSFAQNQRTVGEGNARTRKAKTKQDTLEQAYEDNGDEIKKLEGQRMCLYEKIGIVRDGNHDFSFILAE